jgi:hypothetical protein
MAYLMTPSMAKCLVSNLLGRMWKEAVVAYRSIILKELRKTTKTINKDRIRFEFRTPEHKTGVLPT